MSQPCRTIRPPFVSRAATEIFSQHHVTGLWVNTLTKRIVLLGMLGLGSLIPASAQTTLFNCSSFSDTGACSATKSGYSGHFLVRNGGDLSGSVINFVPANSGHNGYGLAYYNPANIQSFVTTFTFIPNGQNIAFVIQNTNNTPGYEQDAFSSGAGCEGGFYQAFNTGTVPSPNNLFALEFDSGGGLSDSSQQFTYSSVQIYHADQSPCIPNDSGPDYVPISKISTYPVPLNSPVDAQYKTTGDVYSATVGYDGSTVSLSLYDVTTGGSCPGSSCFTKSWTGVNIPSLVAGNTAYVGFTAGINIPNLPTLWVDSWSYANGTSTQAASPTFSPGTGNYTSTQNITLSSSSSNAVICYTTSGAPATDGSTGCANGTKYSGAIPVSSSEMLFAVAGGSGYGDSSVASAGFTIGSTTVATPTFSPAAGTYSAMQSVTIADATSGAHTYYTTDGSTPSTSSTKYTGAIAVNATETLKAMAAAVGDTNSAVASAGYNINLTLPAAATPSISPGAGTYTSAQSVTLSDSSAGATIYYTTDGSTPTPSSTEYSGPFAVGSTETLKAMAVASGDSSSAIASAAYSIDLSLPTTATPTFSIAAGTYTSAQSVAISDGTADATIYYTIDGSQPTTSSTEYSSPISVPSTETLHAMAVASGDSNSAVASATYSINSAAPAPNFMLGTSVNSLAINSGGQGTVMVTVTPENGFSSPVVLACGGLPAWATCSFGESTVTPSGVAATTQLIITTNSQTAGLPPGSRTLFPFTALGMTVGLFGWRKRRGWGHWLLLAVAYGAVGLLFGCSSTSSTGGTTGPNQQTSTVTVTAISGTLQGSAAIAVTVN